MTTSAAKEKNATTKRGRKAGKKTAKKRQLVDEIIKAEPKKRGRKPKDADFQPINRGVKKVNLGHRAVLAKHLGVSTQTIYNRERAFDKCLPEYFRGMYYLPKRGGALKVLPDLTPYQQYCQMQFEKIKQGLGVKDCTPSEMLISNNLEIFDINLFERQQQLTVSVEVDSISIEEIEKTDIL